MKQGKKGLLFLFALCMLVMAATMTSYAATKKITSVTIKVEGKIEPEVSFGQEELEITTSGSHYSYDSYDIENEGFAWYEDDVPVIKVYLYADENYYFSLTASKIKIIGGTYVQAEKQDSSTCLIVTIQLPSLAESVGAMQNVTLGSDGVATWDSVAGAGSYEVRVLRESSAVGTTFTTTTTSFDCTPYMTKAANYKVRVRAINKLNASTTSTWKESDVIYVGAEQAALYRAGGSGNGAWQQDAVGWWYQHIDGTYTKNGWEQIAAKWYCFNEAGYMMTGWIPDQGKQYYCDVNTGAMLTDATTPDGHIVGADGAMIQ